MPAFATETQDALGCISGARLCKVLFVVVAVVVAAAELFILGIEVVSAFEVVAELVIVVAELVVILELVVVEVALFVLEFTVFEFVGFFLTEDVELLVALALLALHVTLEKTNVRCLSKCHARLRDDSSRKQAQYTEHFGGVNGKRGRISRPSPAPGRASGRRRPLHEPWGIRPESPLETRLST
ncbi:MAG: hypothetical protein KAY61_00605, partial [Candidatus Eisenbacteria bacterium]|nr:hypothetical protein [Candidatus Eisenbacteria bacterium]